MASLDDIDPSVMFILMKGEPGMRKSTQALSFPGPQYWFSWDRKMSGIVVPNKLWNMPKGHVTYDDYDDWNKARAKLEQLTLHCPYKTIIFDSLTSMADMTLRQTLQLKYGKNRKSGEAAGKLIGGIAVNEIEDYNAESGAMNELISLAKDVNIRQKVTVIVIAHVMEVTKTNVSGATTTTRTIVTAGKRVAAKVPAYCTEVWQFNLEPGAVVGTGEYSIVTETNGDDFARTSIGLPKKIIFGDKPLYKDWIEPALTKLKEGR